MFTYREKQSNYWRNTDHKIDPVTGTTRDPEMNETAPIPFSSLPKKPFQRSIQGSERLEQIRAEIRSNTAKPLENNEGWSEQYEKEAAEYEAAWREQEERERQMEYVPEGKQAALEYTLNKTMEKEVSQHKQEKRAKIEEYTRAKPVKLKGVETSNQLYYGSTVDLKHYWAEKQRERQKRKEYEQTIYQPDHSTKAQITTQTVGANKIF